MDVAFVAMKEDGLRILWSTVMATHAMLLFTKLAMELFKYQPDPGFVENVNLKSAKLEWYVSCLYSISYYILASFC